MTRPLPPDFHNWAFEKRDAFFNDHIADDDRRGDNEEAAAEKARAERRANGKPNGQAKLGRSKASQRRGASLNNDARPRIRLCANDIERITDEAQDALIKAERGLYQRDGRIVSVEVLPAIAAHGRKVQIQRISERGEHALKEDLSSAASFEKFDGRAGAFVPTDPPTLIVKTLQDRSGRLRFPPLSGIINTPTMRGDGSILDRPGYDSPTGLLFDPLGIEFPAIPVRPTKEDARAALALIEDLIHTFPFVAEIDRAVALSAILTALIRRSLIAAPMHAYTATVAGSGKSLLVDVVSAIATGHEAGVIAQGSDEEELEKRLGAALIAGDPIIAIDNCERPVEGQLLCQLLTQLTVKPRILGRSENSTCSTGAFITSTGNNLILAGDLIRRAVLCRLDAQVERPELRVFDRDPVAHAKANRPALAVAALTILRSYQIAGRPGKPPQIGSFAEWSDLVRGALLWLGCADPVATMETIRGSDPRLGQMQQLMAAWREAFHGQNMTVASVIKVACEQRRVDTFDGRFEFVNEDLREALLNVAGRNGAINNRALGNWLSSSKGRLINGLRFEHMGERGGITVWALVAFEGV